MNIYNYNHLFYFYVTAKLNGVTAASRHLNTSQSSLSSQIRTLEGVLGTPLFQKAGRRMELTERGREMFNYCRRAFEVFEEMSDQLVKTNSSMGVRISIGVSVDVERPFITNALSKVSKQFPKDQRPLLNLISLPSNQLVQLLRVGELDMLLTTNVILDQDIKSIADFDFPVGLVAPLAIAREAKNQTVEEFIRSSRHPLVLPSRLTSLRSEIDSYFVNKKLSPDCVFESNIIASVIRAASEGLGATIMPLVYAKRELKAERLIQIGSKPLWKHRISFLSSRQHQGEGRKIFAQKMISQIKDSNSQ